MENRKKIVVLGAGFGGLRAAVKIGKEIHRLGLRQKYEVILIDRHAYHTYTPTLYEIATTSQATANYCDLKSIVTVDIAQAIKGYPLTFVNDHITSLDLPKGDIHCQKTSHKFDYLVLAIGSETNYFDIPGLRENSLAFKTFMDALTLRDKIVEAYSSDKKELRIAIGGAGSTGVELAGELKEWLCELAEEFKKDCRSEVTLIGGPATILPGFLPKISALAEKRLHRLGVEMILGEKITRVEKNLIELESKRQIPYDIFIWTGGVKASSLMATLPLKSDSGRIVVGGPLQCLPQTPDLKLSGSIYGLGDAICFYDPVTGKPSPLVARAAILQADVVAKNTIEDIKMAEKIISQPRHANFIPHEYPYIVPVGGKYAIAKFGSFIISGFWGWILKGLVELNYLLSILSPLHALRMWLKGLRIFIQNDRLG